ncbi:hypothetical protein A4X13_0g3285 [Tilletia indica]|uniref:DUF7918 domain-containing protein n=1 Tax=Tilletia indica TaxID=43049 RepID=A0A8T8T4Z9_9BASI|nr:hypothetical protein A4X13_0g3285 [Tilletia indica]
MIVPGFAQVTLTDKDGVQLTERYYQGLLPEEQMEELDRETPTHPIRTCFIEAVVGMEFKVRIHELLKPVNYIRELDVVVEMDGQVYEHILSIDKDSSRRDIITINKLRDKEGQERPMMFNALTRGDFTQAEQPVRDEEEGEDEFDLDSFKSGEVLISVLEYKRFQEKRPSKRKRERRQQSWQENDTESSDECSEEEDTDDSDDDDTETRVTKKKKAGDLPQVPQNCVTKVKERRVVAGFAPLPQMASSDPALPTAGVSTTSSSPPSTAPVSNADLTESAPGGWDWGWTQKYQFRFVCRPRKDLQQLMIMPIRAWDEADSPLPYEVEPGE